MQKIWKVLRPSTPEILNLTDNLGISSLLAHLLINRGIKDPREAENFLNPRLSELKDPFLFKDMKKTVERIRRAIGKKEKILIYGDYDVDGISGIVVLIRTLRKLGGDVHYYIPHRLEEGYGINEEGIRFSLENRFKLLITVDCGISNRDQINSLAENGLDVIVTDHHEPVEDLPLSAFSIINPLSPGETYPDKNLSGAGVAFKLCQALLGDITELKGLIEFVSLGTVADASPLKGENRILVKYGLDFLSETKNPGIKALMEIAEIGGKKELSPYDISFILGPRINAMGRLDSAERSLKLLLTDSLSEAMELAQVLEITNRKRQEVEERIYNEAREKVEREINFREDFSIILEDQDWHQGVIGIVAGKLTQLYARPVILFSLRDRLAFGSGRVDLEDIHLLELLDRCKHLFHSYGGHRSACGIRMEERLISQFRSLFNQILKETFPPEIFLPSLYIDGEISLSSLNSSLVKECQKLAPFGEGNPSPLFASYRLKLKNVLNNRRKGKLEVWITDGVFTYQAKGKDFENWISFVGEETLFDLVYTPSRLNIQGEEYICLNVEDFRNHS